MQALVGGAVGVVLVALVAAGFRAARPSRRVLSTPAAVTELQHPCTRSAGMRRTELPAQPSGTRSIAGVPVAWDDDELWGEKDDDEW